MSFRRRHSEDSAVLPSLDRLSGLIERMVELVEAIGETKAVPAPEPVAEPPREVGAAAAPVGEAQAAGWVAFVSSPQGYRLVDCPGSSPARGEAVELDGGTFTVVKVARSPLPGDPRRCAYVAGEEPPTRDRTSDAW
jgi:hypothetical protein